MPRRLLFSTVSVAVIAVLLLGVPLGLVGTRLLREEAMTRLTESAQRAAAAVEDRIESGLAPQPRLQRLVGPNRRAVLQLPDGRRFVVGPDPGGDAMTVRQSLAGGGTLTVSASSRAVSQRIARAWLLVAGLVLAAVAVAIGLAIVVSRRLVRPLQGLALAADRLGSGDVRPVAHRYGVPEIDNVAVVLDRTATRIAAELRRARQFAADASHQLRTPLTALSIRLEEIGLEAEDPAAVRAESSAALAQVERLAGVVDQLLARARGAHAAADRIDVAELIAAQVEEYAPAFRRAGRQVSVDVRAGLVAAGSRGGVAQALSSLLDNALVHGGGEVTVRARPAADHVVVEVADRGEGVAEHLVPRLFERSVSGGSGTGLGLALARALVEADRGRLELVRSRPAVFAMFLPIEGKALPPSASADRLAGSDAAEPDAAGSDAAQPDAVRSDAVGSDGGPDLAPPVLPARTGRP